MKISTYIFASIFSTISVDAVCTEGDIRLADGGNDFQGRVEVCHNNIWGTVCDDSWSRSDGVVACRQLRLEFDRVVSSVYFGRGTGQIWLDNLFCTGSETRLIDCRHNGFGVHNCGHHEDAGVICGGCIEGDIRLADGGNESQGRVEVCHDNVWGTVCDNNWSSSDGIVVCRQLELYGFDRVVSSAYFGRGTGQIWLDNLSCTGSETRLFSCRHNRFGVHNCDHHEDAGVICGAEVCVEGDIRLVSGRNAFEGRVEVCHNNEWGTVCDDSWSTNDGMVACHQLGYSYVRITTAATFGEGTGLIWLDNLSCRGSESQLINCLHSGFGEHDCGHNEDAGVVCTNHNYTGNSGTSISDGGIAGIAVGGQVFFLIIIVFLIVACVCLRRHYKKQHNHCHPTAQYPPSRIPDDTTNSVTASASSPPPVHIQTQSPAVHYVAQSPTNSYTFVPSQSGDYPSQPPPKYIPEPPPPYPEPPPDYTPN